MSSSSFVRSRSSNGRVMNRLRSRCCCGDPFGKWTSDYGQQQVEGNFFDDIVEQPVAQPPVANQPVERVAIQVQNGQEGGNGNLFYMFMVSFVFVLVMLKDL
ncbi:unnamed protein product [Lactuca saligna]|uniref:Uncharacterized protein n=1 Tax=Lactuca saligna TaxID=75948 RepID=A0AA35V394_LACSI|nr:unnamed protein product [Lactuca saligna]